MKLIFTTLFALILLQSFGQTLLNPGMNRSKCNLPVLENTRTAIAPKLIAHTGTEYESDANYAARTMAPANDDACSAQVVTPDGTCVAGTNVAANDSWSGEIDCATTGNGTSHEDVWYKFVATGTQFTATITAAATWTNDVEFVLAEATSCSGPFAILSSGTCGPSPLSVTVNGLVVGNTYYCTISNGGAGVNAPFTFCPTTVTPPCTVTSCSSPDIVTYTAGTQVCQTDCNTGSSAGPDFTGNNCYDFPDETYWYQITTTATSATMDIDVTSTALTNPYFAVFTTTGCLAFTTINCTQGAAGAASATITVAANTTYLIAVSDQNGLDGSFNFCATVNNDNSACNKTDALTVSATSMGSPLAGPYKPGEVVSFCYTITNFTQFNCNYLQGIVPSFGNGWDPSSFTAQGAPAVITTPLVTAGTIQTANPNPGTNACAGTPAGTWSWFTAGAVTYNNINNPAIPNGTPLGAGWYFLSSYSPATGLCTGDPTDPDNSYGDSDYPSCLNNSLDWQVCFQLTARVNGTAACTAGNTDCSVTIKTYADGEIGVWNSVGCTSDIPTPSPSTTLSCCVPPPVSAGTDTTICSGIAGGIGAAATAGFTYSWTPTTGLSSATAANPTVTLTNTGATSTTNQYIVTITETATSCTNTDTVIVTVKPSPSLTATVSPVSQAVCSGTAPTISLSSNVAGATFAWTVAQTNVTGANAGSGASISETLTASTTSAGTAVYTITPTANSCVGNSSNVTITVNPIPDVTPNPATQTFCSGSSTNVALSSSVSGTAFNWTVVQTNVSGASNSSGNTIGQALSTTSAVAGTAVYTITPTANSCSGTPVGVTINVNPIDNPAFSYSSSTYCTTGTDPAANITGGATGIFSSAAGLVFLDNTTGLIDLSASTLATYTITFNTGGTCPSSATFTLTITNSPNAAFSYSGPYCQYGTNPTPTFMAGASAGTFTSTAGLVFANANTGLIDLTTSAPATYWVYNTITAAGGCSAALDSNTVTINAAPIVAINAAPNDSVCSGTSLTLSGTGANSYTWNNSVTDGVAFTALSSLTYTVTGTDLNTCQDTASINITVHSLPVTTANATSDSICAGSSVTLSGVGALSYTWDNSVVDGVAFIPAATDTFTVTGTDLNGCVDTAMIIIVVNSLPAVSANAVDTSVCNGSPANVFGSGATSYVWNNGVLNGVNFTPTDTLFYTVTGTDANGCSNIDSIEIIVNSLPTVIANTTATDVCPGGSVTLTGSGASSYNWDNGVIDGVAFNPINTATYTVTGTDLNGCQDTAMITITSVNTMNVVALATDTMLCTGDSVTLTGSGASSYAWDNGVTDGVGFVPSSTIQYTVTGTIGVCTATDTITIYVNTLPTVTANTTNDSICAGSSVTLTGGGASTYTWDNGVTDGVSFSPAAGTLTYIVTGTDANGCQDTAAIAITVNTNPTVTANTTANPVCNGGSVTLTGGGASTYTWDNGVTDGVSFNPAGTLTYIVTGTDVNGCQDTAAITITVSNPIVIANATSDSICAGGSVTLTGGGASTYTWDNGVTDGVSFSPAGTLTYIVTGTDANGCQDTAAITITVNTLPTVTANTTNDSICAGSSVTLTGGGASTYTWDNGVTDGVSFSPAAGTITYIVTGTDANGCQDTAAIAITVNTNPTVTANTTANPVCNGGSVTLTGGGASTYTWDNGVTDGVSFNPAGTLTYIVTGTDVNGCQDTAAITITVSNPIVIANATSDSICAGGSVILTGGGASTYTWDNGVTDGVSFNPAGTLTYIVTGTDANGCQDTAAITITVNTLPTVTANTTNDSICAGSSVTLTGGGASTYTWDNGVTDGVSFSPAAGTITYIVTGTDVNGCQDTAAIAITVNTLPVATATANTPCVGQSLTLTGGPAGMTTYTWTGVNTGNTQNLNIASATAANAGVSTLTVVDANGCQGTASVTVVLNSLPVVTANSTASNICQGQPVTLTGGGANTYSWDNGVTNAVAFNPAGTLTYTVTGTDLNNCSNTATVTVTVDPTPALTNNGTTNPAICGTGGSVLNIAPTTGITFSWANSAGNIVSTTADLTGAVPGAYTLTITNSGGTCPQILNYVIADQNNVVADFTASTMSGTTPISIDFTNQSQNAITYSWSFGDGNTSTSTNASNIYNVGGTYNVILTATGSGTCVDYDTLVIVLQDSIIPVSYPNVFSPNNDGSNDLFYIKGNTLQDLTVKIYNRWGLLIFEYNDLNGSWDGVTASGTAAPDGVYYFTLDGTFKDGTKIPENKNKGYLTLVR